jgi:hypothetical protein
MLHVCANFAEGSFGKSGDGRGQRQRWIMDILNDNDEATSNNNYEDDDDSGCLGMGIIMCCQAHLLLLVVVFFVWWVKLTSKKINLEGKLRMRVLTHEQQ